MRKRDFIIHHYTFLHNPSLTNCFSELNEIYSKIVEVKIKINKTNDFNIIFYINIIFIEYLPTNFKFIQIQLKPLY